MWLLCCAGMLAALLSPLADADLPLHLRLGDLLLSQPGWPRTELVAWTRPHDPWYAYSWLPEMLYASAWRAAGDHGLAVLHALLMGASLLAMWDLARRDGWTMRGTRLVLVLHFVLWGIVQPATRPQLLLAIAVPMAWSAALRLRDGERTTGTLMAAGAAALAVNSHLLFPLGLLPAALVRADHRHGDPQATLRFVGATMLGWCATPYLVDLPHVFALNFARNALFDGGAAIQEHEPGFVWLTHAPPGMLLITLLLLVLPVLPGSMGQHAGRLRWLSLTWLVGLVLFALAVRGLLLWWLLSLPLVAATFGALPLPTQRRTSLALRGAWGLVLVAMPLQAWQARAAASTNAVPLPHPEAFALEPSIRWVRCRVGSREVATATTGPRGTTVFNYGSYLAWRVPAISWSVDGRTIFPDSVARPEATQGAPGSRAHPPYGSASVVVLPPGHATSTRLDGDSTFRRVRWPGDDRAMAQLWVRRSWEREVGATPSGGDACGDSAQP